MQGCCHNQLIPGMVQAKHSLSLTDNFRRFLGRPGPYYCCAGYTLYPHDKKRKLRKWRAVSAVSRGLCTTSGRSGTASSRSFCVVYNGAGISRLKRFRKLRKKESRFCRYQRFAHTSDRSDTAVVAADRFSSLTLGQGYPD